MINLFHSFIDYFIPENLRKDPFTFRTTKAFVIMFWFTFSISTILFFLEFTDFVVFSPSIGLGLLVGIIFIFLFKKSGSKVLFCNLFVAIYVTVLIPSLPDSGYLYSDNLLWLIIAPLIALLFGNKVSGIVWFFIIGAVGIYSYEVTNDNHLEVLKHIGKKQLFISYTFLSITLYGIVLIFEKGLDLIIVLLRRQKHQLRIHKNQLKEQTALLTQQKEEIEQKNLELELIEQKLLQSNQELESFAFAASHDLKEPLRMISMYTQLLKKYVDTSQKNSTEYMYYITNGTTRMQQLLDDLLNYSRLGMERDLASVANLNETLLVVIHNIVATLKDTQTLITAETLPCVRLSKSELTQLFQNLISNAIKFRKPNVKPEIKIYSKDLGDFHQISVQDNGIGIKKEYHEKVFKIFERLHSKAEYEGTGIGLATVRKIVHSVGGDIWLESTEGVGTTFHFTLPKCQEAEKRSIVFEESLVEN